ncbi:MAG: hypothetical protein WA734_17120, partial [Candidatus Acidiferrales bacterium]
ESCYIVDQLEGNCLNREGNEKRRAGRRPTKPSDNFTILFGWIIRGRGQLPGGGCWNRLFLGRGEFANSDAVPA